MIRYSAGAVLLVALGLTSMAACSLGEPHVYDLVDAGSSAPPVAGGCDPTAPFGTPVEVTELEDAAPRTFGFVLTPDERTAYFAKASTGKGWGIYYASRDRVEDHFATTDVSLVPGLVSQAPGQQEPWISPDGLTLYYSEVNQTDSRIYMATRPAPEKGFSLGHPVEHGVNDAMATDAFLSPDGKELFFARAEAAHSDWHLFVVRLDDANATPQKLAISGTGSERSPALSHDGLTLFYSTSYGQADGKQGIWEAHRDAPGAEFGDPRPVMHVAGEDQYPQYVTADGCTMYFNRGVPTSGTTEDYFLNMATRAKAQ